MDFVTIAKWLAHATEQLSCITDASAQESHFILCDVLQKNSAYLISHSQDYLDASKKIKADNYLHQRLTKKPLAYALGHTSFYGNIFKINEHVLIPRSATESLVDYILQHYDQKPLKVADLGTGSGAIACTLAHHRKNWHITATDISTDALAIASHNAHCFNLPNMTLLQSNWFEKITDRDYDLIISNPPYIDFHDADIDFSVTQFEPSIALFSNNHGLFDIEMILRQAKNHLKPHGKLIIEHGYQQQNAVIQLARGYDYQSIQGHQDLSQLDRFVTMTTKKLLHDQHIQSAENYYSAMLSKDYVQMASYLHDQIHIISPLAEIQGKEAAVLAAKNFGNVLQGIQIKSRFSADDQVMLAYDLTLPLPIGTFSAAVVMNFRDELISKIEMFYDARPLEDLKIAIFSKK
jgi:release factor glutamine methyltransferase